MNLTEIKLERYNKILIQLAKNKSAFLNLENAVELVLKNSVETLNVERANIWFFKNNNKIIECIGQYEKSDDGITTGGQLKAEDYPSYFSALEHNRIIDAWDAFKDPRTVEFAEDYLSKHNISSLLDIPIRKEGEVIGVLCFEHIGYPRHWDKDDQYFATSMADFLTMAIESHEIAVTKKQLKESQRMHNEINKELESLLYMSQHNLKAPVTTLKGIINLVKNDPLPNSQYINLIERTVNNMEQMLDELFDISRIFSKTVDVQRIDIESLFVNINMKFQDTFEKNNIDFKFYLYEDITDIWSDRYLITLIIMYLIDNSIKYRRLDRNSVITITAKKKTPSITTLVVFDNGRGIPKNLESRVFDMFQRADDSTMGSGLGLYFVKKGIEKLSGTVKVNSQLNHYTKIIIDLPNIATSNGHTRYY